MKTPTFVLPAEVKVLNKKFVTDPDFPPQFQLHRNSIVSILDNVTFGPGVTIAAGENARISLEDCYVEYSGISAHANCSVYLRHCRVKHSVLGSTARSVRMLLEYLRIETCTISSCPLVSGKRQGNNREFHLCESHISGNVTLKGNGKLTSALISAVASTPIKLHHGYTDKTIATNNPQKTSEPFDLAAIALAPPTIDPGRTQ